MPPLQQGRSAGDVGCRRQPLGRLPDLDALQRQGPRRGDRAGEDPGEGALVDGGTPRGAAGALRLGAAAVPLDLEGALVPWRRLVPQGQPKSAGDGPGPPRPDGPGNLRDAQRALRPPAPFELAVRAGQEQVRARIRRHVSYHPGRLRGGPRDQGPQAAPAIGVARDASRMFRASSRLTPTTA